MTFWAKDEAFSARLSIAETPGWWRTLAVILNHSGDVVYLLVGMGLLLLLGSPAWKARAFMLFMADATTFIIVQVTKLVLRRPRPEGEWGHSYRKIDPFSFPSGHAARGGAIAGMGLIVGPIWFGLLLAIWGTLLALSRVAMGVHYVSDSVAGFVVGAVVAALLALLVL